MEGKDLLKTVKGKTFNAELRSILAKEGFRRVGNQWVSKSTAAKYEFIFEEHEDSKIVVGLDVVEGAMRIHVQDGNDPIPEPKEDVPSPSVVHHKTATAILKQLSISDFYFEMMDKWNYEIETKTPDGQRLNALTKLSHITWQDFLFLPDPTGSGEYLFGTIREGKAAQLHAWLAMPDGRYIVPTDGTEEGAFASLSCGQEFHKWEFEQFETPAAAGQFTIKMLNASNTTYAQAIRRILGKESAPITRNDFYRNKDGIMCRLDVMRDDYGLHITDVPCLPTMADCLDCLLAVRIRHRALMGE